MNKLLSLAGCAILDNQGRVLLLHRNTPKRVQWEMPGGKTEPGETPEEACLREAREELNVEVEITRELGRKHFTEDGFSMEYVWLRAKIMGGQPVIGEPRTFDDLRFFSWDELIAMPDQLSPNVQNFLAAYRGGSLDLYA